MSSGDVLGELAELVPSDVLSAYGRFLANQTSDDAYLFTDARVRFEARDDDVLVALPGLLVEEAPRGTRLRAPALARPIELGLPHASVSRFFAALDAERSLAEARAHAALARDVAETLVRALFGLCLFAPLAVAELEFAVPAAEIVRFPGSPYEIPRSYWSNMVAVRRLAPRLFERASEPLAALEELRHLHVVLLVGETGASFYRPASPIAKKGITPGKLWLARSRTLETPQGTRFIEGPRVNASFLGGDRYGALIAELARDPRAVDARLEHVDGAGLAWGRVVLAQAQFEPREAPWFCPPRPLSVAHVESLFSSLGRALAAARANDREPLVRELAGFHQKLVRLHPFRAANQSLAMSIVNAALSGSRPDAGGIPHLVLDQLALRLSADAYERVFALAVDEWTVGGWPAERLRAHADKKRRAYALIERVQAASDLEAARTVATASPADARLALLAVRPSA